MAPVVPPTADPAPPAARRRTSLHGPVPARGDPVIRAAVLAAAAAIGVLVGLGARSGASLGRLGVVTLRLRGLPEFVAPDRRAFGAALVGGVHVAIVAGAWGAAAARGTLLLAAHGASRRVQALALAVLAAAAAAVDLVLPSALRLAAGALSPAERVLTTVLVAACAAAAVWRTPSPPDRTR